MFEISEALVKEPVQRLEGFRFLLAAETLFEVSGEIASRHGCFFGVPECFRELSIAPGHLELSLRLRATVLHRVFTVFRGHVFRVPVYLSFRVLTFEY